MFFIEGFKMYEKVVLCRELNLDYYGSYRNKSECLNGQFMQPVTLKKSRKLHIMCHIYALVIYQSRFAHVHEFGFHDLDTRNVA